MILYYTVMRGQRDDDRQTKNFNFGHDNGQGREPVKILGNELQTVQHFKYIGSILEETGGMATEITQSECSMEKLEEMPCSFVWQENASETEWKGLQNLTVVRPARLHGAETWETTRRQEARR